MASQNKQTEIHPTSKLQGGVAIGGVTVEAEFVHCYKYSVLDLQITMCIRRHVTLVYPIYPPLFAFQSEHNLEASCLLTLLVWARRWGEHCFVYFGKPSMNVREQGKDKRTWRIDKSHKKSCLHRIGLYCDGCFVTGSIARRCSDTCKMGMSKYTGLVLFYHRTSLLSSSSSSSSRVFCPRADPSLQTQASRLKFCPKADLPLQTQEPIGRLQFY